MTGTWVLVGVCVVIAVAALWTLRSASRASRDCRLCHGRGYTDRWGVRTVPCPACPAGQALERSMSDDPDWPIG